MRNVKYALSSGREQTQDFRFEDVRYTGKKIKLSARNISRLESFRSVNLSMHRFTGTAGFNQNKAIENYTISIRWFDNADAVFILDFTPLKKHLNILSCEICMESHDFRSFSDYGH